MTELVGLDNFFKHMNGHFEKGWVLVGGCAAWVHIKEATPEISEWEGVYKDIFPKDIDVVATGESTEELTVKVGEESLQVDFVSAMRDGGKAGLCEGAIVFSNGARALPIDSIIFQYDAATSKKPEVRGLRVWMLKAIKAKRAITREEAKQEIDKLRTTKYVNPLLAAKAGLKKT